MSPIDLRLGRWQDVLADVTTCDAVICDPPYSARTHEGYRPGSTTENKKTSRAEGVSYPPMTDEDIAAFCASWLPRIREWAVIFSDHRGHMAWEAAVSRLGWYTFAPVGWVKPNTPRLSGDGPSVSVEWVLVARPKHRVRDPGSRPGHYIVDGNQAPDKRGSEIVGQKPLAAMRAIVRDYSRPGDLIVDPFCGSGTTALAAAMEGRRCITSEEKPEHYAIARKRLERGYQPCLM